MDNCLQEQPPHYSCVHVRCNRVSSWRLCSGTPTRWSIHQELIHQLARMNQTGARVRKHSVSVFHRSSSSLTWTVSSCNLQLVRPLHLEGETSMEMYYYSVLGLIQSLNYCACAHAWRRKPKLQSCRTWTRATVLGQRSTWLAHDMYPGSSGMIDRVVRYRREHRVIW